MSTLTTFDEPDTWVALVLFDGHPINSRPELHFSRNGATQEARQLRRDYPNHTVTVERRTVVWTEETPDTAPTQEIR